MKVILPAAKVGFILAATFAFIFAFGDFAKVLRRFDELPVDA